jgi:cysteinyl-tRNA synthetase
MFRAPATTTTNGDDGDWMPFEPATMAAFAVILGSGSSGGSVSPTSRIEDAIRKATTPAAADAALAMLELSKAGLDVTNTMDAARGVLMLAAAGQMSNAEAAQIAAGALNAFGLEGSEAARVANLLAAGKLLGLLSKTPKEWEQGGDTDENTRIDALVQARVDARAARDWAEADRIRKALADEGVEIMDGPAGSTWRRI